MYPNIILTNRLQPDSIVNESDCSVCDFNKIDKKCDKKMDWSWRIEYFKAKANETRKIKDQLKAEKFDNTDPKLTEKSTYNDLTLKQKKSALSNRLENYTKAVYSKSKDQEIIEKQSIVCQKENPFYVNTVKKFRDRRYEFKTMLKEWKAKHDLLKKSSDTFKTQEASKMVVVYESLQLAHKCILNSFYGYVMRRASRWYSMEMAGIVCSVGKNIIQRASKCISGFGIPLELDTDGIWCLIPSSFPNEFEIKTTAGLALKTSFLSTVLNYYVHQEFTNHVYFDLVNLHEIKDNSHKKTKSIPLYKRRSENSIFFEIDGPYKAMILPSAKEEGKTLKKRYAVFNKDNKLAELKGFEIKRRGELNLIKIFQSDIFAQFLKGTSLEDCYNHAGTLANKYLDILFDKGSGLSQKQLFDLISESKNMSRALEKYGSQKSTSITTAKRLSEFLGVNESSETGTTCQYIISKHPSKLTVSERAIPIAIFSAEEQTKLHFLRKWTSVNDISKDVADIIDWDYYIERFGSMIQKLIVIPAVLQNIPNPTPRVECPSWVMSKRTIFNTQVFSGFKTHSTEQESLIGIDEVPSELSTPVDPIVKAHTKSKIKTSTYKKWLCYQKKNWFSSEKSKLSIKFKKSYNLGSIAHLNTNFETQWFQIIKLVNGGNNNFKVWAVSLDRTYSFYLSMVRTFYVETACTDFDILQVQNQNICISPFEGEAPLVNQNNCKLYKLKIKESYFVENRDAVEEFLQHPAIRLLYGTQISNIEKTVLGLGCLCKHKSIRNLTEREINIDDLEIAKPNSTNGLYLDSANVRVNYMYLSHYTEGGNGHVFILFCKNKTSKCSLYFMGSFSSSVDAKSIYRKSHTKFMQTFKNSFRFAYEEEIVPEIFVVKSFADLNDKLKKVINKETALIQSNILIFQSNNINAIKCELDVLYDHPVLVYPFVKPESLSWAGILADDWLKSNIAQMYERYFHVDEWLNTLIDWASYSNIPVGNIPENNVKSFVSDALYYRHLNSRNIIAWWADAPEPDLAGYEAENKRFFFSDLYRNNAVEHKGQYNTVSVVLNSKNVLLETILNLQTIDKLEGISASDTYAEHLEYSNNNALNLKVILPALVHVVKKWIADSPSNKISCSLLENLEHWLMSPFSKMFLPPINYLVLTKANKLTYQYISLLKTAGCNVVYSKALLKELIITTPKISVENAMFYIVYALKSLNIRNLFDQSEYIEFKQLVHFEVVCFVDRLMWLNEHNFGAIHLNLEDQLMSRMSARNISFSTKTSYSRYTSNIYSFEQKNNPALSVVLNFKSRSLLPYAMHKYFDFIIVMWLQELNNARTNYLQGVDKYLKGDQGLAELNDWKDLDYNQGIEALNKLEQMITESLSQFRNMSRKSNCLQFPANPLSIYTNFEKLKQTINEHKQTSKHSYKYVSILQAYENTAIDASAEWVGLVLEILKLDSRYQTRINSLERTTFQKISNTDEVYSLCSLLDTFSENMLYIVQRSTSIKALYCTNCCYSSNIQDLIIEKLFETNKEASTWNCLACKKGIDQEAVEDILLTNLTQIVDNQTISQIKCQKCKTEPQTQLSYYCPVCANDYIYDSVANDSVKNRIVMLFTLNIAKFLNFRRLVEAIEFYK